MFPKRANKYLKDHSGDIHKITMMDLRSTPGIIVDAVQAGVTFVIEKAGKEVAVLQPLRYSGRVCTVDPKGNITYMESL